MPFGMICLLWMILSYTMGVTMPFDVRKHTIVIKCDDAFRYDLSTVDDTILYYDIYPVYIQCV